MTTTYFLSKDQRAFAFDASVPPVLEIEPGDTVTFYSDGVSEALNPSGQVFGTERLAGALQKATTGAEAARAAVVDAVRAFSAGADQSDDVTMVSLCRVLRA